MTVENQDFEIISLDHPDYIERMNAIDNITDFKILEKIFITDEYITVKMKALDRLTELFYKTNKYKKMIKLWKDVSGFLSWIHFIIDDLHNNNNIEKTIKWILEERGYPFKDFWNRWYCPTKRNQIFQKVVDVMLLPIKINDNCYSYYGKDKETGIEVRWTKYGPQYHYEMVIKILVENDNKLSHEYIYIRCWNANKNTHEMLENKINYKKI